MKVIEAYMGPIFPAGFSDGDHPTVGLILLGNTGIGKSFLANILIGIDTFEHRCGTNSVTHETCWDSFLAFGRLVTSFSGLNSYINALIRYNDINILRSFPTVIDRLKITNDKLVDLTQLTDLHRLTLEYGVYTTSREDAETISNLFKIVLSNGFPRLRTCIALDIGTFTYNETWIETPKLHNPYNRSHRFRSEYQKLQALELENKFILDVSPTRQYFDGYNPPPLFKNSKITQRPTYPDDTIILVETSGKLCGYGGGFRYEEVFTPSKTLQSIIESPYTG
ncbi:hypothetical protein I4U23_027563 [Adineta vaga]|nr:hypothetical protein I4U23_027563 [Adineta vaga]